MSRPPKKSPAKSAKVAKQDDWSSLSSGLGGNDYNARFISARRMMQPEIDALFFTNAIFRKIVKLPADAAVRRWLEVHLKNETVLEEGDDETGLVDAVSQEMERLELRNKIYELMVNDRKDGGGAIFLGVDDGRDMNEPLDVKRIRSFENLHVLNTWEIRPDLGSLNLDPLSPNFRQPEYFSFMFSGAGSGTTDMLSSSGRQVHASRLIVLQSLKQFQNLSYMGGVGYAGGAQTQYNGWNVPMVQSLQDALRTYDSLYQYTEDLFRQLNTTVYTIPGASELLNTDEGSNTLIRRLIHMRSIAGVYGSVILDGAGDGFEAEEFKQQSVNLSNISELMLRMMDRLSAACGIPITLLFGQSPSGLSTDDKSAARNFYDMVASDQRRILTKPIQRVIDCIVNSKDFARNYKVDPTVPLTFEFLPLEDPNELELAQVELAKAQTLQINTAAISAAISAGIISIEEAREQMNYEGPPPANVKLIDPDQTEPYTSSSEE